VWQQIRRELPSLRGVFHCAAVIRDASLANIDQADFVEVLRPKLAGAWNLHRLTREDALEHFVLYSSATTLFGNPGQASYVAANLYLEALAAHRRGLGLPALAVGWGAIGGTGHLARNPTVARMLNDRAGVRLLDPGRALKRLGEIISGTAPHLAFAEMSWARLAMLPAIAKAPKFARVRAGAAQPASDIPGLNIEELRSHLSDLPRADAIAFVEQMLVERIAGVVGLAPAKLPVSKPLFDLGMDSLMLLELQLGLEKVFGVTIPAMEFVEAATVQKLALRIIDGLGVHGSDPVEAPDTAPARPEEADRDALEASLEKLLEADLDRAREYSA
jgi:acyl carrier protein